LYTRIFALKKKQQNKHNLIKRNRENENETTIVNSNGIQVELKEENSRIPSENQTTPTGNRTKNRIFCFLSAQLFVENVVVVALTPIY